MQKFDLLSIGHSNIPADRFVALLRGTRATAIADVRSVPASRHFPWFSGKRLAGALAQAGLGYAFFGDALGGRPRDAALYCDGVADYEAMARRPEYQDGIARLLELSRQGCVCVMCAEREPLDCHRCLLVARTLAQRGRRIGHILHDGTIEPHADTERRLRALTGTGEDLFTTALDDQLADAYRRRAGAVAYRARPGSRVSSARAAAEAHESGK